MIVGLSHFMSGLVDNFLLFFKWLKKPEQFQQSIECEEAFQKNARVPCVLIDSHQDQPWWDPLSILINVGIQYQPRDQSKLMPYQFFKQNSQEISSKNDKRDNGLCWSIYHKTMINTSTLCSEGFYKTVWSWRKTSEACLSTQKCSEA